MPEPTPEPIADERHAPAPILFVHHRSELGGAPASLSYVISNLDRTRYEPHVYTPAGPAAELFRDAGAIVHTGPVAAFTHIWASTYSGRRWLVFGRELLQLPRHIVAFRRVLRSRRFVLAHLNDSPLLVAGWLAHRARVPVVWHLRSALPHGGRDRRSALIRGAIRRFASASIAINPDVAELFDISSSVVPNSVDLERFRPGDADDVKRALDLPLDRPVVAYFGFIYPSKGFREFLSAAARIQEQGHDPTFLVVGGAVRGEAFFKTLPGRLLQALGLARDYEREAKEYATQLGLSPRVRFVPFTHSIEAVYRASDIVVAPSRGPEIARPVIEAAASGIPVVASGSQTGGGIVLPEKTGLLVREPGIDALASAVSTLLEHPERRREIGRAARLHAEQTFDPEQNTQAIEAIYDNLLALTRKRILFAHHRPQLGGAPLSLAYLIRYLDPVFESHVYCPDGPAAELFEQSGATVHRGPISMFVHVWDAYKGLRWALLVREIALLPHHLWSLRRVLRRERFDIVHLNESTLLPAAWLAHRMGIRVVWHLRTALVNEGLDRRSRFVNRVIDHTAAGVIAIDADVAARFHLHMPISVIPNSAEMRAADPIPSREAKEAFGLDPNVPAIGFFGFIRRHKGWPELVEAARIVIERGIEAQFVVLGGGVRPPEFFHSWQGKVVSALGVLNDEESAIHELVDEAGLTQYFRFAPFMTQTRDVYRALDLIAFPNQGVGLGRPVIEAAANARPVVASGSATGAEILSPGETGLLVERDQPEDLADAIAELLSDPERRAKMGEAAHQLASERFDPLRNAQAVELIYRELLGMPTPEPNRARAEQAA